MIITRNTVDQKITISNKEFKVLLQSLFVQQFKDPSRNLNFKFEVRYDVGPNIPRDADKSVLNEKLLDSINISDIYIISLYHNYGTAHNNGFHPILNILRGYDDLDPSLNKDEYSTWTLNYTNPAVIVRNILPSQYDNDDDEFNEGNVPLDMQFYVSTAFLRAELASNVKYMEKIPETAKICTGFRLLNHRYYLMTYMPEKPADSDTPWIPNPLYFIKLRSTVQKVIKEGRNIESMYGDIPDLVPSAYAVFGDVKHVTDNTIHWVGITTKEGLKDAVNIDCDDIEDMWKQINNLKVLPIINIAGSPISLNSIENAESIMGLVMVENEFNPDFNKFESLEDNTTEYNLPDAVKQ